MLPLIVLFAPVKVTLFAPPSNVPLLFIQFPATLILFKRITVMPEFIAKFPKVIFASGLIVLLLVNVELLVAFNVSELLVAVKFPPKFKLEEATVVNEGLFTPPNESPPLKLIVPVLESAIVPELNVSRLPKVSEPVETEIT